MPQTTGPFPPDANRVVVSVNPKAGRRSVVARVDQLIALLSERGMHVERFTDLGQVAETSARLFERGELRALVGIGGDGTAAALLNLTPPGLPITLLAAGTANLLAKHFRLSAKPEKLCQAIVAGRTRQVDAARAGERLFLVMLGCGFDAEVVEQVHAHRESSKKGAHISYFSYLRPIARSIRSYRYPELRVEWENNGAGEPPNREEIRGRWLFVCNLPRYGWGLPMAPTAVPDDGALELVTFRRGSLFHGLRYVAVAQLGLHRCLGDCTIGRASKFRITSDEPVAYQLDGDPGGHLPVDVEVLPGRLTLVVPE